MAEQEGLDARALNLAAGRALAARDYATAAELLEQALQQRPDPSLWLNLAGARRAQGELRAAMGAVEGALKLEPRSYLALLMKASLLERQGRLREAGAAYGVALTQAPPDAALDPPTRAATAHARDLHGRFQAELESFMRAELAGLAAAGASPEGRRMHAFVDQVIGKRRPYPQQPTHFHYPGLPVVEFFDREPFPWLEDLEAATDAISQDLAGLLDEGEGGLTPYIQYPEGLPLDQWAELNHSPRWSAFHLYQSGEPVAENLNRCPNTRAVLASAPQPDVSGRSPAAMFSVLKPKTRIPPHTGVANTRLVVHLPLIVPPGCRFRVGGETRSWRRGEAWVFDDTIEHEAWNDSDQTRIILIFDIWRPELSEAERQAVTAVMTASDSFIGAAPEPVI